ncbi:MAG: hypothetical protein P8J87_16280 [Verrucomicrobiales bacterium]|nr:hypothetical protein [Verrucomicrobiales bacterium]
MKKHEWKEVMEDGTTRILRASHKAGQWWVMAKLKGGDWETLDPVPLVDLRSLREVLWNKYQRNRLALKSVEEIDQMIARAEGLG